MKEFWNDRYQAEAYAYGTQPNAFFKEVIDNHQVSGKILLPAEGEGRNAVYAAKKGLEVHAFDLSEEGRKKAKKLASSEHVSITYELGDFMELELTKLKYEFAALIYAHFPPNIIAEYYSKVAELLLPEGILILEGFSKKHIELQKIHPQVGGPKNIDMLFSIEQVKTWFPDFEILQLEEKEIALQEGEFHNGIGSVIRFVGRKKR